ncbi:MAG: prepilin-type N-terminal cleavage/methylation domain-containing protein [Candidatus Margulisbacteria bacterium]|nr:prepilin-type N-terminal cleavage/methylation domain-containing protein [Candidatus Margulisiibacteriota bacterium]
MKNRGFTLVEVIVAISIVIIISAVVMINLNPFRLIKLDAAAKKVSVDLQYARNLALSTAKWYGVSFEVDPVNTYSVFQSNGANTVIEDPARPGESFVVNLYDYLGGVKIWSVDFGGAATVKFNPLGIPYRGNGTLLTATSVITLEYSGITKTVQVTPNTGSIPQ